jgi:hypothetical protein
MSAIIDNNMNDNMSIHEIEENIQLQEVQEVQEVQEIEHNKYEKYNDLVELINEHIQSYSKFVDNTYFKEIYSTHKTEQQIKLLKEFSKTIFQINNDNDLENFMKYAEHAEKIMSNTEGMIGFCKSFAECFVWHIQQIITKIKNNNL